jgi:hypothetical protein
MAQAFISYSTKESGSEAILIHDKLEDAGFDIFLADRDNMNDDKFENILVREIKNARYIILLLAPNTLRSTWVLKEITLAVQQNKKIIPMPHKGYNFPNSEIPYKIRIVKEYSAIPFDYRGINEAINALVKILTEDLCENETSLIEIMEEPEQRFDHSHLNAQVHKVKIRVQSKKIHNIEVHIRQCKTIFACVRFSIDDIEMHEATLLLNLGTVRYPFELDGQKGQLLVACSGTTWKLRVSLGGETILSTKDTGLGY